MVSKKSVLVELKMLRSIQEDAYPQESDDVIDHHSLCTVYWSKPWISHKDLIRLYGSLEGVSVQQGGFRSEGMA